VTVVYGKVWWLEYSLLLEEMSDWNRAKHDHQDKNAVCFVFIWLFMLEKYDIYYIAFAELCPGYIAYQRHTSQQNQLIPRISTKSMFHPILD
jgi:hypothetical protein